MDLLKLIINPDYQKNTCFLCFKCDDLFVNLFDKNEIHHDHTSYDITLMSIMNELFPTVDILLNQACTECANLIIKIYLLLQKNQLKNELLSSMIGSIVKSLNQPVNLTKSLRISIDMPTLSNEIKQEKSQVQQFKCQKCEMEFGTKIQMKEHSKLNHSSSNQGLICDTCGKCFKRPALLKLHLTCHQTKECPYCFKQFKSLSHFKLHVKSHLEWVPRRKRQKYYACKKCDYKTSNRNTLDAHVNKHHLNVRPNVCEVCNKGFYRKGNLKEHMASHFTCKEKICDVCGDGFANSKSLNEHLRLHSGLREFPCDVCGAEFVTRSRRYQHMGRMHRERNESCEVCGKVFGFKYDLRAHMKNIHGVKNVIDGRKRNGCK